MACGPANPAWASARRQARREGRGLHEGTAPPSRPWPRCCPTSHATPTATWPSRTAWSARSMAPTPRGRRRRWARPGKAAGPVAAAAPRAATAAALAPAEASTAALVCHGMDSKIVGPASRRGQEVRRAGRRPGLPGQKIQSGGTGVGRDPHARANPARRRRQGHRTMAGRWREEVNRPRPPAPLSIPDRSSARREPMQTRRKMLDPERPVAGLLAAPACCRKPRRPPGTRPPSTPRPWPSRQGPGRRRPGREQGRHHHRPRHRRERRRGAGGLRHRAGRREALLLLVEKNPSALARCST
jgi:hypothetical protein